MATKLTLAAMLALALPAGPVSAASWLILCASPCLAPDGTTQTAGIAINRVTAATAPVLNGFTVLADDGRQIYSPALPAQTLSQQATAALSAGLSLTWTASTALNGTYAVDPLTQANIQAELLSILENGGFTNGTGTLAWLDISGAAHSMTVTQFKLFATAVGAYVGALVPIASTNSGTLPAATVQVTG